MLSEVLGRKDSEKARSIKIRGDSYVNTYELTDAIEAYNASMCYALMDTLELWNGYCARADVYAKVELYDEAIASIEYAMELNQTDEERLQLKNRKKALIHMKAKSNLYKRRKADTIQCPKISHRPHKNVPFASDKLEVQESEQYGRFLTAKEDLKPGDIVILEEPVCKVLDKEFVYKKCTHCLKSNNFNLIPCSRCSLAMFCSKDCMNARKNFHKYECNIMGPIINVLCNEGRIPWISLRLLLMTLMYYPDMTELKAMYEEVQKTQFPIKEFNFLTATGPEYIKYILSLAAKNKNEEEDKEVPNMVVLIVNLLSKRTELKKRIYRTHHKTLLKEILTKYFYINMANNFALTSFPAWIERSETPKQEHFGCALFPFTSLINHACVPNLKLKFIGESNSRILIFAIRPIKAGEQLFITYKKSVSFLDADRATRQQEILNEYGFECTCKACTDNYPLLKNLNRLNVCTEQEEHLIQDGYIQIHERLNIDEAERCLPRFSELSKKYQSNYPSLDCYKIETLLEYCMSTLYRSRPFFYE